MTPIVLVRPEPLDGARRTPVYEVVVVDAGRETCVDRCTSRRSADRAARRERERLSSYEAWLRAGGAR